MANFDDINSSLDEQNKQRQQAADKAAQSEAASKNADKIVSASKETAKGLENVKGEVKVINTDLAKSQDVDQAVEAIKQLNLTTFMQNEGLPQLAKNLSDLSSKTQDLQDKMENEGLKKMSDQLGLVVKKLDEVGKVISKTEVSVDAKLQKTIDNLSKSIDKIDFNPTVNVSAPDTKVVTTPVDFKPILAALSKVEEAITSAEVPDNSVDLSPVTNGLSAVQNAITALRFPVPNYVLPFVSATGKATQVKLGDDGSLPITASISTGGLATSVKQSDGSQKTQIVDGLGNVIASTGNALNVAGSFSSTPPADVAPATQNVTVVDSGSTSTVSNNGQTLVTGSPTASSVATFSLSSLETVRVQVSGTWTGTLASEISIDGGTTWFAQGLHQGAYTTSTFFGNFVGGGSVTGATNFRMRATATVTGTAVVKIIESINTNSVYIANAAPAGNVISLLNSSTATLTSGSAFTGAGEDVSNFSEMRISVTASHASAGDGLSIQQSPDNTNWDITDTYTIPATTAKTFVVPRQARYFRIVYTNGGTNQSSFRLQSILNRTATAPSSQRATDGYTNETDLVQNQTFLMGYNGTTWDRVRTVNTGVQLTANAARLLKGRQVTTITSSTSETTIVTAVASTFLDIYRLVVTNTSASACTVTIKDSTAGTTVWVWNIPAGDSRGMSGPIDAAANQSAVNNNWTATCGTSVASIVLIAEFVKNT